MSHRKKLEAMVRTLTRLEVSERARRPRGFSTREADNNVCDYQSMRSIALDVLDRYARHEKSDGGPVLAHSTGGVR